MDGDRQKTEEFLGISFEDFEKQRDRRYGTANPDLMDVQFWHAMIKHRPKPYWVKLGYEVDPLPEEPRPVWSFDRLGMSRTELPYGETVFIGGEYDDYYDPDFCIYNDVIVQDEDGSYKIYGYPKHDFPPLDNHSATYVEDALVGTARNCIVIIGGNGYEGIPGITNVFTLELGSYVIRQVETTGDNPGWVHRHQALLSPDGDSIIVFAGKAVDASEQSVPMDDVYRLNLASLVWDRVGHLPARELLKPKPEVDREEFEMDLLKTAFGYQGTEEALTEKQRMRIMLQHQIDNSPALFDEEMLAELKQMLEELED